VQQHHETAKHVVDAASIGIVASTIMQWLPAIAAIVSIIWGLIRIYETKTVQRLLGKAHRRRDDPPEADTCKEEK
jgi:cadmium resistance protein CadD (predicted permease)